MVENSRHSSKNTIVYKLAITGILDRGYQGVVVVGDCSLLPIWVCDSATASSIPVIVGSFQVRLWH